MVLMSKKALRYTHGRADTGRQPMRVIFGAGTKCVELLAQQFDRFTFRIISGTVSSLVTHNRGILRRSKAASSDLHLESWVTASEAW